MEPAEIQSTTRQVCYRCFRPEQLCWCRTLPQIQNRTRVVILQHPRERAHPIGTALMAHLALRNSELHVDYELGEPSQGEHSRLAQAVTLPPGTGILYPGPNALLLSELPPEERPQTLVVLDGTWHHAHYLYRDCKWLHPLPCYTLQPKEPSRYRIRKEPAEHCLSTVEAIVSALGTLEPELQGLAQLLSSFDRMIDAQIDQRQQHAGQGRHRKRSPKPACFPRAILNDASRLVAVYAEFAPCPATGEPQLFSWNAHRLGSVQGSPQRFSAFAHAEQYLAEALEPMLLAPSDLDQGARADELAERWRDFARPDDIYVSWMESTLQFLPSFSRPGQALELLALRSPYLNLKRGRGCLEAVVKSEGLERAQHDLAEAMRAGPPGQEIAGRAADRLSNLVTLLRALRSLALESQLAAQ